MSERKLRIPKPKKPSKNPKKTKNEDILPPKKVKKRSLSSIKPPVLETEKRGMIKNVSAQILSLKMQQDQDLRNQM